ncbi:MAG TPA: LytTR family transcriptional regulator DNA-binding domain-containing protein [Saprospiraceae bacterium]|nr:LytTR family transcriptional regulator DNA-binding domain-containing protein [Saprospiraceae bacterium]HMU04223.1 LytTR family transcriptional regulator DNA-binding domain-containing protein [Saprospiraceae bacterium]
MVQFFDKEILLIDDDKMHLSILEERIKSLGFKNIITANSYKLAVQLLDTQVPDLVITDHFLDNGKTSLDFVKECLLFRDIPTIVITTFHTEKIFDEILTLTPIDFLSKSCSDFELAKSLKLAFSRLLQLSQTSKLKEFFFVKVGKNIKKICLNQIEMISVDGKYLNISVDGRSYIVRSALIDFIKRLPPNFIKVHQSFIVNLDFVETILVEESKVKLKTCEADFSRAFKKQLMSSYFVS